MSRPARRPARRRASAALAAASTAAAGLAFLAALAPPAQAGDPEKERAIREQLMRTGTVYAVRLDPELGDPARGARLARELGCVSCHGAGGHGVRPGWPKLAGQFEQYLLNELRNFRDGERPHAFMERYADRMTRRVMHDLALHYACQGPDPGVDDTARCEPGAAGD